MGKLEKLLVQKRKKNLKTDKQDFMKSKTILSLKTSLRGKKENLQNGVKNLYPQLINNS